MTKPMNRKAEFRRIPRRGLTKYQEFGIPQLTAKQIECAKQEIDPLTRILPTAHCTKCQELLVTRQAENALCYAAVDGSPYVSIQRVGNNRDGPFFHNGTVAYPFR
ncbi:hypothetical protein WJ00_07300 [Burkholderia vietnamiensis]|nr:hypothetical protein WJ00_07300 [Burkholderia vietnamiensis]